MVASHARHTLRLAGVVEYIAFEVGSEPGARVLASLGLSLRGQTLLNAVRRTRFADIPTPKVLGIDDWSLRKGRAYGTILVDLERRRHCQLERQSCASGSVGAMMDASSHDAFRPYAATSTPATSFQTWNRCRRSARYSRAFKRCRRGEK